MKSNPRNESHISRQTYWQGVLETWRRSGLNQSAFCREQSVSRYAFNYWKNKLSSPDETAEAERFVELSVLPRSQWSGRVEITLRNGMMLSTDSSCDPGVVAEMARALEAV